jgi:hypothetical protein
MSMIVTTVTPEGIVMAADSSLAAFRMIDMVNFAKGNVGEAVKNTFGGTCAHVKENVVGSKILSRSVRKLHVTKGNNIVIAEGNQRNIGKKSLAPYIEYFCRNNGFDNPKGCASVLLNYIKGLGQNIDAQYFVCGYNMEGDIPLPEFWFVDVPQNTVSDAIGRELFGTELYGISFCGANDYFSQYVEPINKNIASYSLQDAIDVTLFAIDISMKLERFIDREEGISPPIDLLVIEPTGVKWIQQKTLKAGA